jgi:tetratricopeptide (TPR) repeat protein
MGAFLVRFAKTKIQLGFVFWSLRPRLIPFQARAYFILPMWLVGQVFSSMLQGHGAGVAYWAHIGGFGVGLILALVIRFSGLEQKVDQAIEAKVGWSAAPQIVRANELLEANDFDGAIRELQAHIAAHPDAIDAHEMLPAMYWRKGDTPAYLEALEKVCALHLKAQNMEAAWQDYDDYEKGGGHKMPPAHWLTLCRYAEDQQQWERAAEAYERLAEAWPDDRTSITALLSAGRIRLRQLSDKDKARKLYLAAQNSKVPHAEWADTIRKALEACGPPAQQQVEQYEPDVLQR